VPVNDFVGCLDHEEAKLVAAMRDVGDGDAVDNQQVAPHHFITNERLDHLSTHVTQLSCLFVEKVKHVHSALYDLVHPELRRIDDLIE
jgi:hypothetical protein